MSLPRHAASMYAADISQEDEDAWEFITLSVSIQNIPDPSDSSRFEKRKRPGSDVATYHFVGYVSVYPFWCYPDQVRLRLR